MAATIIDGTRNAEQIRAEAGEGVEEMRDKHGVVPGLAVVLVGDDPASAVYVRNKERAAREAGMFSQSVKLSGSASQKEVMDAVQGLNEDDRVHGILVQLPLPDHVDENTVLESIDPAKDVDGLHPFNMGLLMAGRPRFIPATPSGIQQMLLRSGFDPGGQNVVVLGRSSIVGKPVASLLMQRAEGANAPYAASKAGLWNLTRSMALDWGKDNIQVNLIVPGWIRTEMTTVPLGDIKRRNKIISDTPAGRVGEPEDMTGAAVYLASSASDFMTGKYMQLDGGRNSGDMAWPPSPDQQG